MLLQPDNQPCELDLLIKEVTVIIDKLGSPQTDFLKYTVSPNVIQLFQERGVEFYEIHHHINAERDGESFELNLLLVNDNEVMAIQCLSNLSTDDVDEHLKRLAKLKRLLPTYSDCRVMGAIAAMVIPDNVAQYAYRKGLFVIGQNGEHLEIRNYDNFETLLFKLFF